MPYDTASDDYEDDAPAEAGAADTDFHEDCIIQFDAIISAVQEERALALVDRRFVSIAGAQWEGGWAQQFQNSIMVEINKTAMGVERIIADYRANRVIVDYRAVDKDASEETAELLNGMFRADFYNSKGQQASDNAFEEAVQGGIGAWRLSTQYEDEFDPDNDKQRICFEMIGDADQSVFWDMNARLYDKSDAQFCYVLTAMAQGAFLKLYGADKLSDWPTSLWKAYYDWYTPDVVIVAEYYDYVIKSGIRITLKHAATGEERREWAADLKPGELDEMVTEGWRVVRRRQAKRRQVRKTVMSGAEILVKPTILVGDCIPVIPVYGKRWFIDNMERSRGHGRLAKDAQRVLNVQFSKLTEMAAITPIERPVFTPAQVAGHEKSWAEGNINRAAYQLLNPVVNELTGEVQPAGPAFTIKPPDLPPVLATLLQASTAIIAELTSADDGADEVKSNISAEAMDIAATRTDAKTFIYQDNMKQSWQRCGEVYQSMAREVYFEEGRDVETMDDDRTMSTATLYEGYTDDDGAYRIRNDLQRGKYKVIADVTEATATRRDKTVKNLVNIATISSATDPDMANAALTTAVLNMDGEGINDLQDWLRQKALVSGLVKPTDEEKKQLEAAAQNQKPDPQAVLAGALAEKEGALAGKAKADTVKSLSDARLSDAKRVQTLADAGRADADAAHTHVETVHAIARGPEPHVVPVVDAAQAANPKRVGIFNRMSGLLRGTIGGLSA